MSASACIEWQGDRFVIAIYADPASALELSERVSDPALARELTEAAQEAYRYNSTET